MSEDTKNTKKEKGCEVEVVSRVTGYFQPVQRWNKGKVEEFKDRKRFNLGGKNGKSKETICD